MKITSTRFGELEIDEREVFFFPQGLIGLYSEDRFIFLQQGEETLFLWMQSIQSPDLAFVVTDPQIFIHDYTVPFKEREQSLLGLKKDEQPFTMVTVNLSSLEEITINLKGPLLFNRQTMKGVQLVLDGEIYPLQYPIPLAVLQNV